MLTAVNGGSVLLIFVLRATHIRNLSLSFALVAGTSLCRNKRTRMDG